MLPLVINVEQADGAVRRYAFADSPISIGRSPFAELQLSEPFISRWEGTLRFDEREITYFGLGETNSTYLDGRTLNANEEDIVVGTDSVLTLGELKLRFSREPVEEADLRRKGKRRPMRDGGDTAIKTVYLDSGHVWATPAPVVAELSAPAAPPPLTAALQTPSAALKPQRTDCAALLVEVRRQLAELSEPERKRWIAELVGPDAPTASGELPELTEWLQAIKGNLLPDEVVFDNRQTLTRVLGLVEALVQSLAEIHDAQETVRRRWLGRSARRSLLQSDKGNIVLAYMLNPQADWNERLRELEQSVRDVVTHELALFRATLEGARSLVGSLSPEIISEAEATHESESTADASFWSRLFDRHVRERNLWQRFIGMYTELADGAQYERVFLGRDFARSYLAAMGKPNAKTSG